MKWLRTEKIPEIDPLIYVGLTSIDQRRLRAMYNKIDRIIEYFLQTYNITLEFLTTDKRHSTAQIRKWICFFATHTGAYSHDEIATTLRYKDGKSSYYAAKSLEEQICVDSVAHKIFRRHLNDLKQLVNFTTIKENYGKHEVKS